MDSESTRLLLGVLFIAGSTLVLFASVVTAIELPAVAYVLVGIALFGSVYIVGTSGPGRIS